MADAGRRWPAADWWLVQVTVSPLWVLLGAVGIVALFTSVVLLAVIVLHDLYSHRSQRP